MKNFFEDKVFNEVLFETDNFVVIPSLGSLVEGWLLVVPKKYYLSFSQIPLEYYPEVNYIINSLNETIKSLYGEYVLFEHGPKNVNTKTGCGVDYAHIHLVPCNFDLIKGLQTQLGISKEWAEIRNLSEITAYCNTFSDYLFLQDQEGRKFVSQHEVLPSQTFRKVISSYLGIPDEYDWKENPFNHNIRNTIRSLKQVYVINEFH